MKMKMDEKRRELLKIISAGSIGTVGLSVPVTANESESKSGSKQGGHRVPYDFKLKAIPGDIDHVTVGVESEGSKDDLVAEYRFDDLNGNQSRAQNSLSIDGGEYLIRVDAIFSDGSSVATEQTFSFPNGGVPDYTGILASVYGKEYVKLSRVKI